MPAICTSVTAPTMDELRRRRDAAADADLVELRLDGVDRPDVAGALAGRTRPVVVTCRPTWEGGAFRGSEEERRALLAEALEAGAEYVDVEVAAGFDDLIARGGRRIVLSTHDFAGRPEDLAERVRAMRGRAPGVVKVAVTAHALADCVPIFDLAAAVGDTASDGCRFVWIAMGTAGLPTRLLAARLGSCWTYAGDGVAPGQMPAERLCREFRFRDVTASTAVYGVVGRPIGHSMSPAMHNAAFREAGIDAVYVPLEAAGVEDFERVARTLAIQGASVTLPYKVPFFEHLTAADSEAVDGESRAVGAINTLRWEAGAWHGRNTDVSGFLEPLRARVALAGARVALLGAGGAARAAATALGSVGADVTVYGRTRARAEVVARLAGGRTGTAPSAGSWDVLVNATPVGMAPAIDETPWPGERLDGRVVYDLVYHPLETRLLREARAAGCTVIDGLEMLVGQAQAQFEWWTGRRPPAHLLREAAVSALASRGAAGATTGADEGNRRTESVP